MATLIRTKESELADYVRGLLNPYEEFTIQNEYPGLSGYLLTIRTDALVHRKHTNKNKYQRQSFYQASTTTDLPNRMFMRHYVKMAREVMRKHMEQGEYIEEVMIGGKFQPVKRQFNSWFYRDRLNDRIVGDLQLCHK